MGTITESLRFGTCLPLLLACGLIPAVGEAAESGPAAPSEMAQAIFEEAGVQGGLIVHLGCGDGRLTAALRANRSYLVHGLDTDAQKVESAREQVLSQGL